MGGTVPQQRKEMMPRTTKIALEKIVAAQKRLRSLPVKDNRKDQEEALDMLAGDVRNTLQKGYSLKDVRMVLVETGVPLSSFLLRKHLEQETPETNQAPQKTAQAASRNTEHSSGEKTPIEAGMTTSNEEKKTPPAEIKTPLKEVEKTPSAYTGITIKPDTPDSEL